MTLASAHHLAKKFGGVAALRDASLEIQSGSVHCLVGENGAGKSTLLRAFAGLLTPDRGELFLNGQPFRPSSAHAALKSGVRVLSQDFDLAPNLSVAENLFLGDGRIPAVSMSWRSLFTQAANALAELGIAISPRAAVRDLSTGDRQLISLVRCILGDPLIVFLDEPSSALDQDSAAVLFHIVGRLKAAGAGVVYVTHKLDEVFALADTVTVLRDGTSQATLPVSETRAADLVRLMVGRTLSDRFPPRSSLRHDAPILDVRGLEAGSVRDATFTVGLGEIVGIAGLVGSGRTDLAKALAGLIPWRGGRVALNGREVVIRNRRDALRLGIEYMTEDRKGEGLVMVRNVTDNITARVLSEFSLGPVVRHRRQREFARAQIDRYAIKASSEMALVNTLSGGNQQKVLLAQCLASKPRVIFLDEPTRGIDVGAKAEIYHFIRELSATTGVVVISSELDEVIGLCDRVLVMRHGRIVGEFPAAECTEEDLISVAFGTSRADRNEPIGSRQPGISG